MEYWIRTYPSEHAAGPGLVLESQVCMLPDLVSWDLYLLSFFMTSWPDSTYSH